MDAVKWLIKHNVNAKLLDNKKLSAYDMAKNNKHDSVAKFLAPHSTNDANVLNFFLFSPSILNDFFWLDFNFFSITSEPTLYQVRRPRLRPTTTRVTKKRKRPSRHCQDLPNRRRTNNSLIRRPPCHHSRHRHRRRRRRARRTTS